LGKSAHSFVYKSSFKNSSKHAEHVDIRIDPDPEQRRNVTDLSLCRCRLFNQVWWKSTDECVTDAGKYRKMPELVMLMKVE